MELEPGWYEDDDKSNTAFSTVSVLKTQQFKIGITVYSLRNIF